MSLNILFSIKEGLSGFKRARFSLLVTVFSIALSLVVVGLFLVGAANVGGVMGALRSKFQLEVFLELSLVKKDIDLLRQRLVKLGPVEGVFFVSREDAARKFTQQFGKDLFDVLGENPLPASFQVHLKKKARITPEMARLAGVISRWPGVDEVVYPKKLLELLDRYIHTGFRVGIFVGVGIGLVAVLLVYNSIRLAIYAKRKLIRTMQLVGATNAMIRRPFLVEGVFEGLLGGTAAVGILFVTIKGFQYFFPGIVQLDYPALGVVGGLGMIYGFLGSYWAIRRFLRYD